MVAAIAAPYAILLSKWLVFIRPFLAGFECPLTEPASQNPLAHSLPSDSLILASFMASKPGQVLSNALTHRCRYSLD